MAQAWRIKGYIIWLQSSKHGHGTWFHIHIHVHVSNGRLVSGESFYTPRISKNYYVHIKSGMPTFKTLDYWNNHIIKAKKNLTWKHRNIMFILGLVWQLENSRMPEILGFWNNYVHISKEDLMGDLQKLGMLQTLEYWDEYILDGKAISYESIKTLRCFKPKNTKVITFTIAKEVWYGSRMLNMLEHWDEKQH